MHLTETSLSMQGVRSFTAVSDAFAPPPAGTPGAFAEAIAMRRLSQPDFSVKDVRSLRLALLRGRLGFKVPESCKKK